MVNRMPPGKKPRGKHPLDRRTLALVWDVHTASGVFAAPFLLIILVTGLFMPVHEEFLTWSHPAARAGASGPGLEHVLDRIGEQPLDAIELHLTEPAGGLVELTLVEDESGEEHVERTVWADGATGELHPQHSHLVYDIYLLHFFYQVPYGIYVAGLVGLVLSLSLFSGLLVHLRDVVARFGRLRRQPIRAFFADSHTLIGTVLLVPILVIAVTGAMLGLAQPLALSHAYTTFDGDIAETTRQMGYDVPKVEGASVAGARVDVAGVIAAAQEAMPGLDVHWIKLTHPGADDASLYVYGHAGFPRLTQVVHLRASDLRPTNYSWPQNATPAETVNRWGRALHFGDWGGVVVRLLYVGLALGSVVLTVLGVVLWRRRNSKGWFPRAVEVLTIGSSAGLFAAMSVAVAASQALGLLDVDTQLAQTTVLFVCWGLAYGLAALLPVRRSLGALLAVAALALAVAAVVSLGFAATSSLAVLAQGRVEVLAVDLGLLLAALASGAGGVWALLPDLRGLAAFNAVSAPAAAGGEA